jgi:phosphorylcholine metabolism protein LicD
VRCCKSLLLLLLLRWKALTEELGMTYMVVFGTLLGAMRDGEIVPW